MSKQDRIPQGVDAAHQMIQGRDTDDLVLLVMIPVVIVGLGYMLGLYSIKGLGIGFVAILGINRFLWVIIPAEESITYWVKSYYNYKKRGKVLFKDKINTDEFDDDMAVDIMGTGGRDIMSDGGDAIETEESIEEFTRIKEIDTYNGVIKLSSGEYISAIRVVGMERNLIDPNINRKATESFLNFCRSLDFDSVIRSTSIQFKIDSEVEQYDDRMDDEDVSNKPIFQRVMAAKRNYVNTRIRNLGMNNRQHYVFIRITSDDTSISDGTPFELDFIDPNSYIGQKLSDLASQPGDKGKTPDENFTDMAVSRRRSAKRSISQIRQCSATELNGTELAKLVRNFYGLDADRIDGWEQSSPITVSEGTAKDMQEKSKVEAQ